MGTLRSIAYFLARFVTGYKPTQADYQDLLASLAHKTEDKYKMGGGLTEHDVNRPYQVGEACLVNGRIKVAKIAHQGAYDEAKWADYNQSVSDLGISPWTLGEELAGGVQRTHRNAIYESAGPISGTDAEIEPGVTEGWEDFWTLVVYTEGGRIPVLVGGVVKFGSVYEYTGNAEPKGLYRANFQDPDFDGGFKSGNFSTELAAGKWILVALRSPAGGGGVSLGETSTTAYRGDRGKIAYDHSQITGNPHGTAIGDISGLTSQLAAKADLVAGKVPSSQLPAYVDDVLEFANLAAFPGTGEASKIYVALDSNRTYRWSGSAYVEISPSLALGSTSSTAHRGDHGAAAYAYAQGKRAFEINNGAPSVSFDSAAGYLPGYQVFDTSTGVTWICISNGNGAAEWEIKPEILSFKKTDLFATSATALIPGIAGYAIEVLSASIKYNVTSPWTDLGIIVQATGGTAWQWYSSGVTTTAGAGWAHLVHGATGNNSSEGDAIKAGADVDVVLQYTANDGAGTLEVYGTYRYIKV